MLKYVETGDVSSEQAERILHSRRVAIDTETSGLDWRLNTLELVQLFTPDVGAILIRRTDAHPTNLIRILEEARITKVFHHAPFDLRFLEATWGVRTSPVFCTKTASKLLNPELSPADHSLRALLDRHFGILLDKGEIRVSNWSAPTLSPEQIDYAIADVTNLLRLAHREEQRIRERGLADDFATACAYLPLDAHLEISGIPSPLVY